MDAAELVRAARRLVGQSQAGFAAQGGASARTVGALEAGSGDPRFSTVVRLLAVAGLELTAVPTLPEPSPELVGHLRASTTWRLEEAVVRRGTRGPSGQLRTELADVGRRARLRLDGPSAVGVWLPGHRTGEPLPLAAHEVTGAPGPYRRLSVTVSSDPLPGGDVAVDLLGTVVLVPPPLLLAAHPDCGPYAQELRVAAALLDRDRARDRAGRRVPVHRDPQERREEYEVVHRRDHRDRQVPSRRESRAWRLGGEGSLVAWLAAHPTRAGGWP